MFGKKFRFFSVGVFNCNFLIPSSALSRIIFLCCESLYSKSYMWKIPLILRSSFWLVFFQILQSISCIFDTYYRFTVERVKMLFMSERNWYMYVYVENLLTVCQCQNWFGKFQSGNFDVEDTPRLRRQIRASKTR